jgi:hypothetical protein
MNVLFHNCSVCCCVVACLPLHSCWGEVQGATPSPAMCDIVLKSLVIGITRLYLLQLACLTSFHTDQQLSSKLLKCLSSWFSIGSVPAETMQQSQLLAAIFHFLVSVTAVIVLCMRYSRYSSVYVLQ